MKKQLFKIIKEKTEVYGLERNECFTTTYLSNELDLKRNSTSQYLNEYVSEGLLIKVNTRPVYYFAKDVLLSKGFVLNTCVYNDFESLKCEHKISDFDYIIGSDGSLFHVVEQCKAAVSYPPCGLPVLFTGQTGTGKSMLARTMFEYAVNCGLIEKDKQLVIVNCSEYANNPELLTANLFGYCKGAYTGADKDNPGLIQLADGGMLFLDEVQSLKAECQEKLFLFMDKGIYHRLGDNKNWYSSACRMVFATTEKPEDVLLKTLLRRIPILIQVPSLKERGEEEKKILIYKLFEKESQLLHKEIQVSYVAWQIFMNANLSGNVGGLINAIKAACANAFLHGGNKENVLSVYTYDLPKYLLQLANTLNLNLDEPSEDAMMRMVSNAQEMSYETKATQLYDVILESYREYEESPLINPLFNKKSFEAIDRFNDEVMSSAKPLKDTSSNFMLKITDKIISIVINRYSLKLSNNEILLLANYLEEYKKSETSISNWTLEHRNQVQALHDVSQIKYPREYAIVDEVARNIHLNLDMKIDEMMKICMMSMLMDDENVLDHETLAVILCHGYSTASSIAGAVNKIVGMKIYDAIDMELNLSITKVIEQLNHYLRMQRNYKNLLLLVDMGSLEEIDKGIKHEHEANVGIINNVNTKLALNIAFMIKDHMSIQEILVKAKEENMTQYRFIESKKKEKAILTVCATGEGAAEKILAMFENSLPKKIDAKIISYDFQKLQDNKMQDSIFERYDVSFVICTMNLDLDAVSVIPVEKLLFDDHFNELNSLMKEYLTESELEEFNHNIIKNFTLDNLVTQLTILNAQKVLEDVEEVVESIESGLMIQLPLENKLGLYLHISCLIERLILRNGIEEVKTTEAFVQEHKDFVQIVKEAFTVVKYAYSVEIPDSEIVYIYNYLINIA